jgi:hypothetical protein
MHYFVLCLGLTWGAQAARAEIDYCTSFGEPMSGQAIAETFADARMNGSTASGTAWTLITGQPETRGGVAPAEFSNATGTRAEGVFQVRNDRLCQSYDGQANWICHGIAQCGDFATAYAMINASGERSSVILSVRRVEPPKPLCAEPGGTLGASLLQRWLPGRTLNLRSAAGIGESYVLATDGTGRSVYSGRETGLFWRFDRDRLCVTYANSVGELCRSFAECRSGEGIAVTYLPDGSDLDLVAEVYDVAAGKTVLPQDVVADTSSSASTVAAPESAIESGDAALDAYLAEAIPDHWTVSDIRFKAFPSTADPGAGRLSVAGTLTLNTPLVEPWRAPDALRSAVLAKGLSIGVFDGLRERVFGGEVQEFITVQHPGNEVAFRAELAYLETVDGTDLTGQVNYDPGPGFPASELTAPGAYVVGSSKFDDLVATFEQQGRPIQALASQAFAAFFDTYAATGLQTYSRGRPFLTTGAFAPPADPARLTAYQRFGSRAGDHGLVLRLIVPMQGTSDMATYGPSSLKPLYPADGPKRDAVLRLAMPWGASRPEEMAVGLSYIRGDGRELPLSDEMFFDPSTGRYSRAALGNAYYAYGH